MDTGIKGNAMGKKSETGRDIDSARGKTKRLGSDVDSARGNLGMDAVR